MDHNDQADAEDRDYCTDKFLDEMEELREQHAALRAEVERLDSQLNNCLEHEKCVRDASLEYARKVLPSHVLDTHFGVEPDVDDVCSMLAAEVERLRNWEAFAAAEIANQKSSAARLRDEIENRWRAAFDSIGRALDAYEVAMRRMGHDYDASCSEALYDRVRDTYDAATLPAPPTKEE